MSNLFCVVSAQYQQFLDSLQYELNYDGLEVDGIFPEPNKPLRLILIFSLAKEEIFRLYVDHVESAKPSFILYEDEDLPICEEAILEDMFEDVLCYAIEKINNNFGFTTLDA